MHNNEHDLLTQKINSHLDETVLDIDSETQSKLRQIRSKVIDQSFKKTDSLFNKWIPAGVALASIMIITIVISPTHSEFIGDNIAAEDMNILTEQEDLELYENIEFYNWMSEPSLG